MGYIHYNFINQHILTIIYKNTQNESTSLCNPKKPTVTGDCIEFDFERPKGSNGSFSEKKKKKANDKF